MKKIVIAAAAMGGTALIAFGASGTFAALSDAEQATVTAGAGTLDLEVGGGQLPTAAAAASLAPGQSTQLAYWINNVGTVGGTLSADLSVLENAENTCTEPEQAVGDVGCGWGTGGEFSKYATVQFFNAAATSDATCKTATRGAAIAPAVSLDLAAAAGGMDIVDVAGGSGKCVHVEVALPSTAGNDVQGDTAKFRADVTLTQKV